MLQVGFSEDVEIILERLPEKRQSMMFSATMPSWIRSLTKKYLNDPLTIDLVSSLVTACVGYLKFLRAFND